MKADIFGVAVIGMGFGRRVQIPAFACHPATKVVSICSGSRSRAEGAAREFGIEHFTTDYHECVTRPDVDVVSIVTPPHLHAPIALAAVEAKKHVLCEKPFAINAREAGRMVRAARRARVAGMVDFEFRYLPERRRLKELVDDRWIGELERIAIVEGITWMAQSSTLRFSWTSQAKAGGGVLGALGSHYIDLCRWLGGDIRDVSAALQTRVRERKENGAKVGRVDADDNFSLRLRTTDGVVATIDLCATAGAHSSSIMVFGSKGALKLEGGQLQGLRAGRPAVPVTAPHKPPANLPTSAHPLAAPFYALIDEMVKKIGGERSTVPTFEDGLRVQEIIDAARRSSKSGRTVRLGGIRRGRR